MDRERWRIVAALVVAFAITCGIVGTLALAMHGVELYLRRR